MVPCFALTELGLEGSSGRRGSPPPGRGAKLSHHLHRLPTWIPSLLSSTPDVGHKSA